MQFLLYLKRLGQKDHLPLNYQYELSSTIYQILRQADTDFGQLLHSEGYDFENNHYKPFTFSSLNFDRFLLHPESDGLQHTGTHATLDIRFAVDRAGEGFVRTLFLNQRIIALGDKLSQVDYEITGIELGAPVYFQEEMHFSSLSPICLSAVRQDGAADYLSPYDERYPSVFKTNLLSRFLSFHPEIVGLKELDSYCPEIKFELTSMPKKKVINLITQSDNPVKVNGYQYDFKFKASPILQELGYYGGFGSKNAMGFGCVGVVGRVGE